MDLLAADVRTGGAWSAGQRVKNGLLHALVRAAIAVTSVLPRAAVGWTGWALGVLAWAFGASLRARVASNLASGLGRPASWREVRAPFVRAGGLLADMALLFRASERAAATLEMDDASVEAFRGALARGRGVVFVTAHLGPWERMAALLVERGFPVATVARESYDPRLTEAVYERVRAPRGVRSIYRGDAGAVRRVLRELAAGGAVGFLIDLPSRGVPGVGATLFGRATTVPIGPARVALALGAPVVVGTATRGRVEVRRLETGDLAPGDAGERALAARMAAAVDERVRGEPGAWLGLFAASREIAAGREHLSPPENPR